MKVSRGRWTSLVLIIPSLGWGYIYLGKNIQLIIRKLSLCVGWWAKKEDINLVVLDIEGLIEALGLGNSFQGMLREREDTEIIKADEVFQIQKQNLLCWWSK